MGMILGDMFKKVPVSKCRIENAPSAGLKMRQVPGRIDMAIEICDNTFRDVKISEQSCRSDSSLQT